MSDKAHPDWRATLLVLAVCAVLLSPTLAYRMGTDQGVFAYLGAEVLDGGWPYLDAWESDYPGQMYLQAAQILVFGKSIALFRLFDLLVQLTTVWLIYRIAHRLAGAPAAFLAAAIYCLIYQGYGPWNTAQREGFSLPFILLGYWLAFTADRRPRALTGFLVGLGLGVAFTFKPTVLGAAGFYFPLVFRIRRESIPLLLSAAGGLLLPATCVVVAYAAKGGLGELYEATVLYQDVYTRCTVGSVSPLVGWIANIPRLGAQAAALSLGYLPFLLARDERLRRTMLYLGYLGTVFAVLVQGTFAGYHYLPGLAIGTILIATAFAFVTERLFRRRPEIRLGRARFRTAWLPAALAVLAAIPVYVPLSSVTRLASLRFLDRPEPGAFTNGTVFDFTEDYDLAMYVRRHTTPEDRLLVWGYEPLVYYLAERRAASRFHITHPLVIRVPGEPLTPMQTRWRDEFIEDLRRVKPPLVAVVREDDWWWSPEKRTSMELIEDFPEWKALLEEEYEPDCEIGRFVVYRRRS